MFYTPLQTDFIVASEVPRYFFAVARQPDIVNTARLNGIPVTHSVQYFTLNNSVDTLNLTGRDAINEITSGSALNINCMTQDSTAIRLLGKSERQLDQCIYYAGTQVGEKIV